MPGRVFPPAVLNSRKRNDRALASVPDQWRDDGASIMCRAPEIVNGAGCLHGCTRRLLETLGIQALPAQECLGCLGTHDRWRYSTQGNADFLTHVAVCL